MADTYINNLPPADTPQGADAIIVEQSEGTKRLSLTDLFVKVGAGTETLTSLSPDLVNNKIDYSDEAGNVSSILASDIKSLYESNDNVDTITSNEILNGAVTTDKIIDNAVTDVKLANDSVTTDKIVDNAVTTDKIVDNAITNSKLEDGVVTNVKLGDDVTMIRQVVQTHVTTIADYTYTANTANGAGGVEISALNTSITLAKNNPKIIIQFRVCGELHNDAGVNLYRDTTEIGAPDRSNLGNRMGYFHVFDYDTQNNNTPTSINILYVDDLSGYSAGDTVTYSLKVTGYNNNTLQLNHGYDDGNANHDERLTSTCVLQELS